MEKNCFLLLIFCSFQILTAQELEPFSFSQEWIAKIDSLSPSKGSVAVSKKRDVLIFSLHTGYQHWTIPHTEAVVALLGEKSGAFVITTTKDINAFSTENLEKFDAIVLNNTCSKPDKRNIFWDALSEMDSLTTEKRLEKAEKLEQHLLDFVQNGGGLMVLHGGITMQNKSKPFGEMVGGSFDYHPKQQTIDVKLVDKTHPLVSAFKGEGFRHVDEPYFFNNAYFKKDFRPLLYMEADQLEGKREVVRDKIKYISWIKRYGEGRVFYASPSHNAHSFENPKLLQFLLDGLQYVSGDLVCDDSAMKD